MKTRANYVLLAAVLALAVFEAGCNGSNKNVKKAKTDDLNASAEPDKILYQRSLDDLKHGRYTVERLNLQTLINTYPDSEYLAKSKLAIADSYFKEGGTSNLTQAVTEYKDFITFFPFLDEAPYAQMQAGMAHYRLMEKPDRDRTQAKLAEDEFQTFMLKYPQSPLAPQAEQRLREVQEVLAEGDFRVASFYYVKGSFYSSAPRLLELADRYPLYSQADRALWMLGDIYENHSGHNEAEKARYHELADRYYAELVRNYPLSPLVSDAKRKLTRDGIPVPQPDPAALARMQHEKSLEHERPGMLKRSLGVIKSGPDVYAAAHSGQPNLNPESEAAGTDVLQPGGPTASVSATASSGSSGSGGATIVAAPVETAAPAESSTPPASEAGNPPPASTPPPSQANPAATGAKETAAPAATGGTQQGTGKPAASSSSVDPNQKKLDDDKAKAESSSKKKKKGLRKLIPW
jgi:outer membrane protein assembly factor BamD